MRLEERVTVAAPPERVWELVADPADLDRFAGGEMTVEPEERDQDPGCRARYRVLLRVGSALVGGEVEVLHHEEPRELAWTSVTGVEHTFRLRIRDRGDGCSRVTLRFAYGAPGLVGALADIAALPRVRAFVRAFLERLKAEAEEEDAAAASGPSLPARAMHELGNLGVLVRSGLVAPMRPDKLPRLALAVASYGPTVATGVAAGAIRHPDRPFVADDLGLTTYREVHERSDAIAAGLADAGVHEGDAVGVMCRNHRGFVETIAATAKLGADVLLLNTSFSGPQVADVCKREGAAAVVADEEFTELLADTGSNLTGVLAWHDDDEDLDDFLTLSGLTRGFEGRRPSAPGRHGRVTILTSGTTGTPKGASRGASGASLDAPASILSRIPYREGMTVAIPAPLFHAWGFSNFSLAMALGSTVVLRRRFDPEQVLADVERHACDALVVVPVMLRRILDLPEETRRRYDTSTLRVVAASGSALSGELANAWMDAFGENLHNLYGSTEVAAATIATPRDLRAAPGTAGKPPRGTTVKLFDERGAEVPQGETGRIFVGNSMLFEGYTGGGSKDRIGNLMATGDVGRFDEAGRLFVEGRDDDMIVSGGENVFPQEVEDLLAGRDDVAEAACIGVDDEDFGQRLRAFVVPADGASLDEDELKGYVKQHLANYKVPRDFVVLDELPRNPAGKVLKRELAEHDEDAQEAEGQEEAARS